MSVDCKRLVIDKISVSPFVECYINTMKPRVGIRRIISIRAQHADPCSANVVHVGAWRLFAIQSIWLEEN